MHSPSLLLSLVLAAGVASPCTAQSTAAPVVPADARLSPTLYFADRAAEAASREALHHEVAAQVQSLAAPAALASPVAALNRAWQTMTALQRHVAYLEAQHLENTQDLAVEQSAAAVDTDRSVFRSAISQFVQRLPAAQATALGPYRELGRREQIRTGHTLSPDAEAYRGAVTGPAEQDIADAYDRLIDALPPQADATSRDATLRRAALARRAEAYERAAPAVAALLASLVDMENRDAQSQHYGNAAERKYAALDLSPAVVQQTLATVSAQAAAYREYQQVTAEHAARQLRLASVLPEEAQLVSVQHAPIPWEDARALMLASLQPLGPDYTARFAALLDPANGRLDLVGGAHRANTGTSITVYDAPMALYLGRYDGSLRYASKVIHEGGHAIHRELMNASGIPVYQRDGSHFLMEGVAIFNELLLLDHAAKVASSPAERAYALNALLQKIALELFVSAEETAFERSLYTAASGHALLDRAKIDALYRDAIAPYEYWPMSEVGISRDWMRKSLLFEDPLYLVNYLYAAFIAVALYEKAETEPDFAARYEALLRRGFDADPQTLLASVGIRLDDPGLLNSAITLFRGKTAELRTLYASEQNAAR